MKITFYQKDPKYTDQTHMLHWPHTYIMFATLEVPDNSTVCKCMKEGLKWLLSDGCEAVAFSFSHKKIEFRINKEIEAKL